MIIVVKGKRGSGKSIYVRGKLLQARFKGWVGSLNPNPVEACNLLNPIRAKECRVVMVWDDERVSPTSVLLSRLRGNKDVDAYFVLQDLSTLGEQIEADEVRTCVRYDNMVEVTKTLTWINLEEFSKTLQGAGLY